MINRISASCSNPGTISKCAWRGFTMTSLLLLWSRATTVLEPSFNSNFWADSNVNDTNWWEPLSTAHRRFRNPLSPFEEPPAARYGEGAMTILSRHVNERPNRRKAQLELTIRRPYARAAGVTSTLSHSVVDNMLIACSRLE